ncbi:MAG: hypothetical protein EBS39_09030 [Gammaproteobacteria bacterium]|nr:hypothetical protein [Gammaproteobacteria bacterium]
MRARLPEESLILDIQAGGSLAHLQLAADARYAGARARAQWSGDPLAARVERPLEVSLDEIDSARFLQDAPRVLIAGTLRLQLADSGLALQRLVARLDRTSPALALQRLAARRAMLEARLQAALPRKLDALGQRFGLAHRTLHAVSPLATLDRGYALVTREDGKLLRDAADAPRGTRIEARLGRGRLRATVDATLTDPPPDLPERTA